VEGEGDGAVLKGRRKREKEEVEITFDWGSWMWRPA
jgi:hypothetical protein